MPKPVVRAGGLPGLDGSGELLAIATTDSVWTSGDGTRWTRATPQGERILVNAVSAGETSLAGGYVDLRPLGDIVHPESHGAIWRLADTGEWELTDLGARTAVYDVNSDERTFIAGGRSLIGGPCKPAVWVSGDGQTWDGPTVFDENCGTVEFVDVVDSGYVALSQGVFSEGDSGMFAWYSVDGLTWSRTAVGNGPGWTGLATVGDTAVAVGATFRDGPQLWTIAEDGTWAPVDGDQPALQDAEIVRLTEWRGTLLGTGATAPGAPFTGLWTSGDGLEWVLVSGPVPFDEIRGLAATDSSLFVVDGSGVLWKGEAASA